MSRFGLFELMTSADASAIVALLIRVTVLLACCALAAWKLRQRSAAARHLVWSLGLAGSLLLGVAGHWAPRFEVPVGRIAAIWPTATVTLTSPRVSELPGFDRQDGVPDGVGQNPSVTESAAMDPATRIRTGLMAVWLAGFVGVLGWCALGHIGLSRLARGSNRLDDGAWRTAFETERAASGITIATRLLESDAIAAPLTWGVFRPVIVVPLVARTWSVSRRRAVLRHECAHIARRDCLMRFVATLAGAVYWFHPVVWMAGRRLENEAERACDDRVLAAGTEATDYAEDLLQIARGSRALRARGAVAIGMARRSSLEGRLLAILDARIVRAAPSAGPRIAAIGLFTAALMALAGMRLAAAPSEAGGSWSTTSVASHPSKLDHVDFERTVDAKPGETLTIELENGGGLDIRGWDEPRVRVRGEFAGKDGKDVRATAERDAHGVRLHSEVEPKRSTESTSCSYEIDVPRQFNVRIESGGGSVTLTDLEGEFRGTTGGGPLKITKARGSADLTTGGGGIIVSESHLSGSVQTGGGKVLFSNVTGGLRGNSGSGSTVYSVTESSPKHGSKDDDEKNWGIVIHEAGGNVILGEALEGAKLETGGGKIEVGRAKGIVEATTGGGDIDIGPVAGSVQATTGGGDVHVVLSDAPGDEEQFVEIATGAGRVVVELPKNFDGKFDLETAYTENFGRETRIDSPWELERSVTQDWSDHSAGTPRKFVRARGVAGEGRGRVRIRTVNGDITIRRGNR